MPKNRKSLAGTLANLKLEDLLREGATPSSERLVNLKIPADILQRVHDLAEQLGVTKTAAVIALLNEGLEELRRRDRQLREASTDNPNQ